MTARVGPSVPRQERPARDGARVASIETGLAAAAAKLSHQVRPAFTRYRARRRRRRSPPPPVSTGRAEIEEEAEKHQAEGDGAPAE